MKYREIGGDGDYTLGQGRFLKGREAVAQAILTRMGLLYGEWWENTGDGLPLFEQIAGVFPSEEQKAAIDLIIGGRILGTAGVSRIISLDGVFEDRLYSCECVVDTVYGEAQVAFSGGAPEAVL
jgi:hypothetical protein